MAKAKKEVVADPEPRKRNSKNFEGAEIITMVAKESPKRAGTAAAVRWDCYTDGMTIDEYVAAGGRFSSVNWDWQRGFIKLNGKAHPEPIVKKVRAPKEEKKAA